MSSQPTTSEPGVAQRQSSTAPRPVRVPPSPFALRKAITLIELLITISILAILAALILGAANAATESARRARTNTLISKIHALVMEQYQTYKTRRVDVSNIRAQLDQANPPVTGRARGLVMADARLFALRELMRLEMPQRWTDITENGLRSQWLEPSLIARPSLTNIYRRRLERALNATNKLSGSTNTVDDITLHQSAECLYQIVMLATGDGEARAQFGEQEIGDVDGDGLPEFIDGWGNPIQFLRWAPGFVAQSDLMSGDPNSDPDPFDPFGRDRRTAFRAPPAAYVVPALARQVQFMQQRHDAGTEQEPGDAFRLLPLVFSPGPDGESGINTKSDEFLPPPYARNDPYYRGGNDDSGYPGAPDFTSDAYQDNVHNHLMDNQ